VLNVSVIPRSQRVIAIFSSLRFSASNHCPELLGIS
jgi:hypothetical protein